MLKEQKRKRGPISGTGEFQRAKAKYFIFPAVNSCSPGPRCLKKVPRVFPLFSLPFIPSFFPVTAKR
jgi:hypothetical protein